MVFEYVILVALAVHSVHGGIVAAPAAVAYPAPAFVAKIATPLVYAAKLAVAEDYDPNPQYTYGYDVQDSLTGDSKSQVESRNGDVVQGSYSLTDPDGYRRTVDYTADPIHGFNAVVRREPLGAPIIAKAVVPYAAPVAKVISPVLAAHIAAPLPVATRFAAPLAYQTPLTYATPLAKIAAPITYAGPAIVHPAPLAYAAPLAKIAAPAFTYSASAPAIAYANTLYH